MADIVLIGFMPGDRERLGQLQQALEARGLVVDWWSVVPTKPRWFKDLQRRIRAAPGVIAVWTAASAQDRWSAVAADEALERRNLVSVILDPVEPPRAFRNLASLPMVGWSGAPQSPEMDLLMGSLTLMLGLPPRPQAPPPPLPPGPAPAEPGVHAVVRAAVPVPIHPIHPIAIQPVLPVRVRRHVGVGQDPADPSPREPLRPVAVAVGAPVAAGPDRPPVRPRGRDSPPASGGPRRGTPDLAAATDLERGLGFIPCIYGWAIAWAVGVSAMGLYLLPGAQLPEVARVYIGNPLFSAGSGAAVGLMGAAVTLYALSRERIGLSPFQLALIVAGWGLGAGAGLLAVAWLSLPVVGAARGLVGFDFGWVACWLMAGTLGSLGTWLALRRSHPFLDHRDLAFTAGGFALGAVGGWMAGWLVVAIPILLLDWLLRELIAAGAVRDLANLVVQLLSLGLIGAVGGAAYGLGGGLVIFGALTREAVAKGDGPEEA